MTAVAVWDHTPEAEELLAARVAAGWAPIASRLTAGDQVLGYAGRLPPSAWAKPPGERPRRR